MPMFEAEHRCPDAVVIKPNIAKYVKVGREVRSAMFALTPLVEPLSIDEAFLDLTGTERLHGMSAAKVLAQFAAKIERDLGITVSIGILSANKFLAKIASDMDKPRGFVTLGQTEVIRSPHPNQSVSSTALAPRVQPSLRTTAFARSPTCNAPTSAI